MKFVLKKVVILAFNFLKQEAVRETLIEVLEKLAKRTDNPYDDRLVEHVKRIPFK